MLWGTSAGYRILLATFSISQIIKTDGKLCSSPPPGLSKLRRGVDVTAVDFTPVDIRRDSGFQGSVIDFTCDLERTWRNPLNGEVFDVPDQIESITSIPGGVLSHTINIFKSASDVKKSMSASAGVNFLDGMFSASGSYQETKRSITNHSSYVEEVSAFHSALRADCAPHWGLRLSHYAKLYVDQLLPNTYEAGPSRYAEFIRYYGTHYFFTGKFGGLLVHRMETQDDVFKSLGENTVKTNAEGSFLNFLKAKGAYGGATRTLHETFTSETKTTTRYFGGQSGLLGTGSLEQWRLSAIESPWLFGGELSPISDLIPDENKRAAMDKAIQVHLDRALLREMLTDAYTMSAKSIDPTIRNAISAKIARINGLIDGGSPNHDVVLAIARDIQVPDWFITGTKLCYRWYPDGVGGQCGGGAARLLCAGINSATKYYRDDTDGRGGGCRMSWGITSSSYPDWFKNVQICYRWHPDGDGGQCGGGVSRELCAKVDAYTTHYRDDTDGRGGGCQMSWRITVPSNAPLWMKTAVLCYDWYPDGDGGQCGGGAQRKLCASANTWTRYYRDDTDGRGGGCRMRWGISI